MSLLSMSNNIPLKGETPSFFDWNKYREEQLLTISSGTTNEANSSRILPSPSQNNHKKISHKKKAHHHGTNHKPPLAPTTSSTSRNIDNNTVVETVDEEFLDLAAAAVAEEAVTSTTMAPDSLDSTNSKKKKNIPHGSTETSVEVTMDSVDPVLPATFFSLPTAAAAAISSTRRTIHSTTATNKQTQLPTQDDGDCYNNYNTTTTHLPTSLSCCSLSVLELLHDFVQVSSSFDQRHNDNDDDDDDDGEQNDEDDVDKKAEANLHKDTVVTERDIDYFCQQLKHKLVAEVVGRPLATLKRQQLPQQQDELKLRAVDNSSKEEEMQGQEVDTKILLEAQKDRSAAKNDNRQAEQQLLQQQLQDALRSLQESEGRCQSHQFALKQWQQKQDQWDRHKHNLQSKIQTQAQQLARYQAALLLNSDGDGESADGTPHGGERSSSIITQQRATDDGHAAETEHSSLAYSESSHLSLEKDETLDDVYTLLQRLDAAQQASESAQSKLVEALERANLAEEDLQECRSKLFAVQSERQRLQSSLHEQSLLATQAQDQVEQLQELSTQQQVQLEALASVNLELQQKLRQSTNFSRGGDQDKLDAKDTDEPSESSSCDEVEEGKDDDDLLVLHWMSTCPSELEVLESQFESNMATMQVLQNDQTNLFAKLDQSNAEASSQLLKLCDSFSSEPGDEDANDVAIVAKDEHKSNGNAESLTPHHKLLISYPDRVNNTSFSEKLEVVFEGTADVCDLEKLEAGWMEHRSQIESLQRDQEELLARLRESSHDANTRLCSLSASIHGEETINIDDNLVDATLVDEDHRSVRILHQENKSLAAAYAEAKSQICNLQEQLNAEQAKIKELEERQPMSSFDSKGDHSNFHEILTDEKRKVSELEMSCQQLASKVENLMEENLSLRELQKTMALKLEKHKRISAEKPSTVKDLLPENTTSNQVGEANSLQTKACQVAAKQRETITCLQQRQQVLEEALERQKQRAKEFESVCGCQKAVIESLQRENKTLTTRLLETEADFRKQLTESLSIHNEIANLRKQLSVVANANSPTSQLSIERDISIRDITVAETSAETSSWGEDDGLFYNTLNSPMQEEGKTASRAKLVKDDSAKIVGKGKERRNVAEAYDDRIAAEDLLRLLSFAT